MPSPLISVVIVTWNSGVHIANCFHALSEGTWHDFEIILVDNGSTDGSLDMIENHPVRFPLVVERLGHNIGFAAANNIGARLARGTWLALLNADAYPQPDWLAAFMSATEQNPEFTVFASRQIQYYSPHLLDGAGDTYHISGLAWRNGYNLSADQNGNEEREIFSPCAAAAMYLREEFLAIGGFDEDYFSYFEDVDLGFRLRIRGARCLYVPDAVVHHVGSASTGKRSDFSVYYGYRNMIWTFIKDMPTLYFWLFLPLHILILSFFIVYLTLRRQGLVILRAIFHAMRSLPRILAKRKHVQKDLQVMPRNILRVMSTGVLDPYQEFIKRNRTV